MFEALVEWLLGDFGLAMFVLSMVLVIIHTMMRLRGISRFEILYRWVALLPLGFTGIYTAVVHAFFPETAAALIGWETSPFQFEVAMGDLGIGVLGVLSFNASYQFRLATVIMATIQLWGDAIGHLYYMVSMGNFEPGNAGSWFWLDLLVPAILLLCMSRLRASR